jgi:hypothetical protein
MDEFNPFFLTFLDPRKERVKVNFICIVSIPDPIYFNFDTYLDD